MPASLTSQMLISMRMFYHFHLPYLLLRKTQSNLDACTAALALCRMMFMAALDGVQCSVSDPGKPMFTLPSSLFSFPGNQSET